MIRYGSWSTLFAVTTVALAATLWLQTATHPDPETVTPSKRPTTVEPSRQDRKTARLEKLDAYNAIVERPLFARTRRPTEEAPAVVAPSERTNLPNLILKGIVISPDEKYVLLQTGPSAETLRMNEGQSVDGWRIETILFDRVIFKSNEKTEEVELWNERINAPKQPPATSPRRPPIRLPLPENKK